MSNLPRYSRKRGLLIAPVVAAAACAGAYFMAPASLATPDSITHFGELLRLGYTPAALAASGVTPLQLDTLLPAMLEGSQRWGQLRSSAIDLEALKASLAGAERAQRMGTGGGDGDGAGVTIDQARSQLAAAEAAHQALCDDLREEMAEVIEDALPQHVAAKLTIAAANTHRETPPSWWVLDLTAQQWGDLEAAWAMSNNGEAIQGAPLLMYELAISSGAVQAADAAIALNEDALTDRYEQFVLELLRGQ